jgi:exopolysaccharide production protein ExoQ
MASYAYMPIEGSATRQAERAQKLMLKLFFLLVLSSEASAWVRVAGGNVGLTVAKQAGAFSSGNGDPVLLALNAFVILMTLLITFRKLPTLAGILLNQRALLLIYAYSFVSVLWAENVGNSFRIGVYLLFGLIQFTYIGWFLDAEEQIQTVGQIVTMFAALSVAGQYLLSPSGDLAPGWTGIFPSKNYLGNVMAIGIITLLLEKGKWSPSRVLKLCLCTILLALSQSFTAVLCALLCGMVIFYLRLTRRRKLLLVGTTTSLALFIAVVVPNVLSLLLGASGKNTTLTGRDVIWAFALKYIAMRPFFGYGYYGFWISQQDAALEYLGWNPNQAHNGFLDLALNEGLVGLVILSVVFYVALRRALRQIRDGDATGAGRFSLIMLVYLLIHNISEADFYQRPAWVVFLVAFIASAKADLPVRYESEYDSPEEPDEGVPNESSAEHVLA